jgi:hypothetical protein
MGQFFKGGNANMYTRFIATGAGSGAVLGGTAGGFMSRKRDENEDQITYVNRKAEAILNGALFGGYVGFRIGNAFYRKKNTFNHSGPNHSGSWQHTKQPRQSVTEQQRVTEMLKTLKTDKSTIFRKKDVRNAYRKRQQKVHPDMKGGSTEKSKKANEAWETIQKTD